MSRLANAAHKVSALCRARPPDSHVAVFSRGTRLGRRVPGHLKVRVGGAGLGQRTDKEWPGQGVAVRRCRDRDTLMCTVERRGPLTLRGRPRAPYLIALGGCSGGIRSKGNGAFCVIHGPESGTQYIRGRLGRKVLKRFAMTGRAPAGSRVLNPADGRAEERVMRNASGRYKTGSRRTLFFDRSGIRLAIGDYDASSSVASVFHASSDANGGLSVFYISSSNLSDGQTS